MAFYPAWLDNDDKMFVVNKHNKSFSAPKGWASVPGQTKTHRAGDTNSLVWLGSDPLWLCPCRFLRNSPRSGHETTADGLAPEKCMTLLVDSRPRSPNLCQQSCGCRKDPPKLAPLSHLCTQIRHLWISPYDMFRAKHSAESEMPLSPMPSLFSAFAGVYLQTYDESDQNEKT